MKNANRKYILALANFMLLSNVSFVFSADWTSDAGVSVGEVFTDNVCLEENSEESDWITTLTPDLSIKAKGARANLDFVGQLEFNNLGDESSVCSSGFNSNTDSSNLRLNAHVDINVVRNIIFLDMDVRSNQNVIDPFSAGGDDNLNRTDNTNETNDYYISPYISRRLKRIADIQLRYSYHDQHNSEQSVNDSETDSVSLSLNSLSGSSRLNWGLVGNAQNVDYKDRTTVGESDNELKSANIILGYKFFRSWQLNMSAGEDWNDFVSINSEIDGSRWDAGLKWAPNDRVSLDVGTGNRYFGDTPRFNLTYSRRRTKIIASFSKTLTYTSSLRTSDGILSREDAFGLEVDPLSGELIPVSEGLTTLTTSPIIDERLSIQMSLKGRRTNVALRASKSKQFREEDGRESTFSLFSLSVKRQLSRKLSFTTSVSINDREGDDALALSEDSDTSKFSFGVTRDIGSGTSLGLIYTYSRRDSDRINDDYSENRVSLRIRTNL